MKSAMCEEKPFSEDDAEICQACRNIYKIVWLKEGDDYNDFGHRHCPFCGMLTDEFAHIGLQRSFHR